MPFTPDPLHRVGSAGLRPGRSWDEVREVIERRAGVEGLESPTKQLCPRNLPEGPRACNLVHRA